MDIIGIFPPALARELEITGRSRGGDVSEIRLRAYGRSSVMICGERIRLSYISTENALADILERLAAGAVYAHRESMQNGYISTCGGIRVGVCGQAAYDGKVLRGVSKVSSLVFRIPTKGSEVLSELADAFSHSQRGLLIYSLPGAGKTTALRSLVSHIARGRGGLETAIIDERGEFIASDYLGCSVDILRGYKRGTGMEIALRTLSPEVIVIDEIGGSEEVDELLDSLNSGVRIIASAHADCYENLCRRANIRPLIRHGVFDVFAGISIRYGQRKINIKIGDDCGEIFRDGEPAFFCMDALP